LILKCLILQEIKIQANQSDIKSHLLISYIKTNPMKKLFLLILCIFLIGGLSLTNSCKKSDKIKGCTDKDSKNYDATAQADDGSCLYEGAVVFWYDQSASAGLIADSASALTFYINGELLVLQQQIFFGPLLLCVTRMDQ